MLVAVDSGCTSRKVGIGRTSGGEAVTAQLGEGSCVAPSRTGSRALQLGGGRVSCLARPIAERCALEAAVRSEVADERIRAIERNEWIRISG